MKIIIKKLKLIIKFEQSLRFCGIKSAPKQLSGLPSVCKAGEFRARPPTALFNKHECGLSARLFPAWWVGRYLGARMFVYLSRIVLITKLLALFID